MLLKIKHEINPTKNQFYKKPPLHSFANQQLKRKLAEENPHRYFIYDQTTASTAGCHSDEKDFHYSCSCQGTQQHVT